MEEKNDLKLWVPSNPKFDPAEPMQVGGQAVLEGVMMRAKGSIATAVRRANGEIVVKKEAFHSLMERYPKLKIPVVRGAIGLIEMLFIGLKTLNYSAEVAMEDLEPSKPKKVSTTLTLVMTLVFALLLGTALFFFLPLLAATQLFSVEQQPLAFNLIAGLIRVTILIVYLISISTMREIYTLFQYHGAEHKAVFAFEQNAVLDVPTALTYSRFHPRCGTSFILLVMLVSILLFSVLDAFLLLFIDSLTLSTRLLTHIPFIPIVGGISYEILKFTAKHSTSKLGSLLIAPGLWLQRITTKEPDEKQMEVSLAAMKAALGIDSTEITTEAASAAE
jgi:uncharacterized protein YqhQ